MKREQRNPDPTREPTLEELEQALTIDEFGLEDECRVNPDVFYRVSKQVALAVSRRDAAKQAVKEAEARAVKQIYLKAEAKDQKVTVGAVEASCTLDPEVRDANAQLLELSAQVKQLEALKESFQQRSYALSHLVDLYLHNYYSDTPAGRTGDVKTANAHYARKQLNEMRRQPRR